jgi:hypothetical protein
MAAAAGVLAACTCPAAVAAAAPDDAVQVSAVAAVDVRGFSTFCASWMEKLRDRSSFNIERIKWRSEGAVVVGEHVDYGQESTCVAREEAGKTPIGKIGYREVRYERRGATPEAALAAPGTVIERFDVTEIFRFAEGRWQY